MSHTGQGHISLSVGACPQQSCTDTIVVVCRQRQTTQRCLAQQWCYALAIIMLLLRLTFDCPMTCSSRLVSQTH